MGRDSKSSLLHMYLIHSEKIRACAVVNLVGGVPYTRRVTAQRIYIPTWCVYLDERYDVLG